MERILTQEERIRRAEEIYLKKRNIQKTQYDRTEKREIVNKKSTNNRAGLFKKIGLQIIICLLLYCIFYLIYDTNFAFSHATISKTKEILDYDINVMETYKNINIYMKEAIYKLINTKQQENELIENNIEEVVIENQETEWSTNPIENQIDVQPKSDAEQLIQENTIEEAVPQIEQTIAEEVSLKQMYSLIKPVNGGYISSEFGERESTSEVVSSNHKGIDIAIEQRRQYCSFHRRNCNKSHIIK